MSEISDKGLLTAGDGVRYLGAGQVTVHRWCHEGRLPCSKVRKAQEAHSGTVWLIERGLGLSRSTPLPVG